jgi:hypothetical protein
MYLIKERSKRNLRVRLRYWFASRSQNFSAGAALIAMKKRRADGATRIVSMDGSANRMQRRGQGDEVVIDAHHWHGRIYGRPIIY